MSLEAIRMLREQQSQVKEGSPQWMVAEQLMDICRAEPESAELIAQDLGVEAMSITEAEKKLKAYAKDHANGKTAIFFVRRVKESGNSYFTLELDEGKLTVRQNRGRRNCARTKEVEAFEAIWLAWLRTGAPRDARGRPLLPEELKYKAGTAA